MPRLVSLAAITAALATSSLLAGCPGDADFGGTLHGCFGTSAEDPFAMPEASGDGWTFEGLTRVTEETDPDFNVQRCPGTPTEVVELAARDGTRVWLGLEVHTHAGEDVTPEISLGPGAHRLRVRTNLRWGIEDAAFALAEEGALVAVATHALHAFDDEDLPGLAVEADGGSTLLPSIWPCGMTSPLALRFVGDEDEVCVAPDAEGTVTTSAGTLRVRNVSASKTDMLLPCTDVSTAPEAMWVAAR